MAVRKTDYTPRIGRTGVCGCVLLSPLPPNARSFMPGSTHRIGRDSVVGIHPQRGAGLRKLNALHKGARDETTGSQVGRSLNVRPAAKGRTSNRKNS